MTGMGWSKASALNEDEPTWLLMDQGRSIGHLLVPEHVADKIVEGLNLIDASTDKGLIQAMQDMEFDIQFTPTKPRRPRVRK